MRVGLYTYKKSFQHRNAVLYKSSYPEEGKMAMIVYLVILLVCLLFAALSLVTVQEHR
jgi:hypothetical protein